MVKLNRGKMVSTIAAVAAVSFLTGDVNAAYAADSHDYAVGDTAIYYEQELDPDYLIDDITHSFNFSESEQSFTVTIAGDYQISAYGAAGADYSGYNFEGDEEVSYAGGSGGVVSGLVTLEEGDVVTVTTGETGKGGQAYTVADAGDPDADALGDQLGKGSNGGSATVVKVNGTVVMIAAGGGGASALGSGGPAGTGGGTSGEKGESGLAGGGDGYEGGAATQFTYHVHEGTSGSEEANGCYITPVTTYHEHDGDEVNGGGCYSPVYHLHNYYDENGDYQTTTDETIYQDTDPEGCFVEAGHTHNATATCAKHTETYTYNSTCGGSLKSAENSEGVAYKICTKCGATWGAGTSSCKATVKKTGTKTVYDCGSPTNTWTAGCGLDPDTPQYYVLTCEIPEETTVYEPGCGMTEGLSVESHTDAAGGTNYASGAVVSASLGAGNSGNGKATIALSGTTQTFTAPCSGDYIIESSDGTIDTNTHEHTEECYGDPVCHYHYYLDSKGNAVYTEERYIVSTTCPGGCFTQGTGIYTPFGAKQYIWTLGCEYKDKYSGYTISTACEYSLGGEFTGKIHLDAGDIVTVILGERGTVYEVFVNGESILKFHYHRGYGEYQTDEQIAYTEEDPGGCYVAAAHEHDATRKCSFKTEVGHHPTKTCGKPCTSETSWVSNGQHFDSPQSGREGEYHTTYHCTTGHWSGSTLGNGGGCPKEVTDYDKWVVTSPAHYACGNEPTNMWKLGCGYYDGQAIYSDDFYDVELDAERRGEAYCQITLYKVDYEILVKPNGGYWDYIWNGTEDNPERTQALAGNQTVETQTGTVVHIPNPKREGFTFMGWDITDMDTGTHYYAKESTDYVAVNVSANPLMEAVSAKSTTNGSVTYKDVTNGYLYFMDLRIFNGNCVMKAIWMDEGESELNDDWGGYGATFRNTGGGGDGQLVRDTDFTAGDRTAAVDTSSLVTSNTGSSLNPDSGLALYTQISPYSITRLLCDLVLRDGFDNWDSVGTSSAVYQENAIYTNTDYCTYDVLHSNYAYAKYILGLTELGNGLYADDDEVSIGQYPYVYGVTEDGQRYYPGTWTNKSVIIKATAYDGVAGTGDSKVYNRNGGTGVYRMQFNDYSRYYEGTTERESDGWIYNDKPVYTDSTKDSSMTIEKTFSLSGSYQVSITAEDRAGTTNEEDGGWIANPNGNNVSTAQYGYSGDSDSLDLSTAILIDKDAPVVMDPENYVDTATSDGTTITSVWGNMSYARAKAMMYEGYNEIVDPESDAGEAFGWSYDYVRIVIYADDGEGSGIDFDDAAFCWVPDGSGIDYENPANWQSADSTRQVDGKIYPVSTRTVSEKENGYVYVRDAVGNWAKLRYSVDHFDKQDPDTYPENDPDAEIDDPIQPDPLDPDDDANVEYDPVPDGKYNFESILGTNELKYDWVNHDAVVSFKAVDYAISSAGQKGDDDGKYSSSGIYKMILYRSNDEFPTEIETLRTGKERERADTSLYGSSTKVAEVTFENQLVFTEAREGINYYWLEVIDKAENVTMVKLTVKVDKTYPGIPYKSESEGEGVGIANGGLADGNDLLSNFGDGQYWTIKQVDLNEWGVDEIETKLQDEDNLKCLFEFNIFDRNYSGTYAEGSDNTIDDSGFYSVVLKLVDADDDSSYKTYVLYSYEDASKIGVNSSGGTFDTSVTEVILTNENSVPYLTDDLDGTPYAMLHTVTKINTFTDFPAAAAINYEIEIIDRAGNVKTYSNEPGNEIRNFSIKAVMHSAEAEEFNEELTLEQGNIAENETSVTRVLYLYCDRRGREYVSTYKLSDDEASSRGLTYLSASVWTGTSSSSIVSESTALTNVPYYQLGDSGYVEIWTIGYVPEVQFNFCVLGDEIGSEMAQEIKDGRIPEKYNLGVYGDSMDTTYERVIPYTAAAEIPVPYASSYGGVPFAVKYGVAEAADFADPTIDVQRGWLDAGTSIRMPLYYELEEDGGYKTDGTPTYTSELHSAAFYGWKGNWKDTSTSSYVIYDTRADDIHYRVTHEG